ncbi:MAG: dihydrolipoamide acetyltransferase, partial [Pseudomonadota bacterium]|nr:dihydrolipoamide acetyltransferase [Pseudomonadota bacterium]
MSTIEVKVPDIGDFKDVPVIEVFVKPGDTVKAEDSLVTLESDKATMDVPAPASGTVKEVKVKLSDKVSEGSTILTLETADAGAAKTAPPPAAQAPAASSGQAPPGGAAQTPSANKAAPAGAAPAAAAAGPAGVVPVKVPDIGDFKDVPVIEVFVKPGDAVKPEDPLVTLESDKATMDVPAPAAGTVKELKVKVGDKVSEGNLIVIVEVAGAHAAAAPKDPAAASATAPTPSPSPSASPSPQA